MKVEKLKISEVKQALELLKKFIKVSPVFKVYKLDEKRILDTVYHSILDDKSCMLAAKDGDKIIGLLGGYVGNSWFTKELQLREYGVFVEEEYRGNAIGFKLLLEWFKWGKLNWGINDCWMCLNTGLDPERALKRFKKLGFKQVGVNLRFNLKDYKGEL